MASMAIFRGPIVGLFANAGGSEKRKERVGTAANFYPAQ